jgi:hypothetical protein
MELHRRIREEKENPHVALDNAIEYLKNMTRDEYINTPVYKCLFIKNLTAIYQETLNYPEFEEISEDLATILEELEKEDTLSFVIDDLVSNLDIIHQKFGEIENNVIQSTTLNFQNKIGSRIHDLTKDNCDMIFDHPYYLAPFTYQGIVD